MSSRSPGRTRRSQGQGGREGIGWMRTASHTRPTNGIHGTAVAVDFEACIADGVCMDVCPVFVFEWLLNPGQSGTGKEKIVDKGTPEWNTLRTDKSDPCKRGRLHILHGLRDLLPDAQHQDHPAVGEVRPLPGNGRKSPSPKNPCIRPAVHEGPDGAVLGTGSLAPLNV